MAQAAQAPTTTKTKAKKRYLKAKKERRKKRKTLQSGERKASKRQEDESATGESDSSGNEAEEELQDGEEDASPAIPVRAKAYDGERPKKRRKLDTPQPRASSPPEDPIEVDNSEERTAHPRPRSPTPPVALPAFPQPRTPEAPSRTVLALQGLDKALIEAEVVNAATTLPLETSKDAHDERTGLSGKMRRRLQDLGITELFAGLSAPMSLLYNVRIAYAEGFRNSTDGGRPVASLFSSREVAVQDI